MFYKAFKLITIAGIASLTGNIQIVAMATSAYILAEGVSYLTVKAIKRRYTNNLLHSGHFYKGNRVVA